MANLRYAYKAVSMVMGTSSSTEKGPEHIRPYYLLENQHSSSYSGSDLRVQENKPVVL